MDPKDIATITTIAAVAAAGNVTLAARRRGVAQPALDRVLAAFDRAAGAQLFVRRRNDVRLTAVGRRLLRSLTLRAA